MPEGIEIIVPGETFRIATGSTTLVFKGMTFHPAPVVLSVTEHQELLIGMPADHPFARRYIAGGVPRKQTQITILRISKDMDLSHIWRGELTSAEFEGGQVRFRVASLFTQALKRQIPSVVVSRSCQHRLYDSGCCVDRKSFTRSARVVSINGYEVSIDIMLDKQWARRGEFVHVSTGERIDILDQVSSVLTLQAKPYATRVGDEVQVSAGCDREIVMCRDKFNNVANYGGFPHLPTKNPFQ